MRRVTLPGTEIEVSRLSFGTASLHHLPTRRRRQDLLAVAFDSGFSHFDTAPYYGFGIAESELGVFFGDRHGKATVTTKIGLYPPGGASRNTAMVWARKLAGRAVPALSQPVVDWSIARAAESLDSSLRRLRVDRIDLLLLHEPLADALESDAFVDWLGQQQVKGKIRAWGLGGEADRMGTWLSSNHPLGMVLQVRDSLDRREADLVLNRGRQLQITFGYLGESAAVHGSLSAREILAGALRRNKTGSVIVSTRRLERVSELAAVGEGDDGRDH